MTEPFADRYHHSIMDKWEHQFDAFEVHGVRDIAPMDNPDGGTICEVDDENPQFYSVYVHMKEGGVLCVGDFSDLAAARGYAVFLEATYGYPLYDHVGGRDVDD